MCDNTILQTISKAERKLRENFICENQFDRAPAIYYALSPDYLNNECYRTLLAVRSRRQNGENIFGGHNRIWGLFWIRLFYEDGDGNDFFQIGNGIPNDSYRCWFRNNYTFSINGFENAARRDKFRAECWLVSRMSGHGNDSRLTTGMRFLLRELPYGFTDDQFDNAIQNLVQWPDHAVAQIAAARIYRNHFIAALRAMQTGEGEGWLATIAQNPVACEIRQPKWGVWVNGSQTDIAFCVITNQPQLEIVQDGNSISKKSRDGRIIVRMAEILRERFDLASPIRVANHNIIVPQLNGILLARRHVNESFSEFIDRNAEEAISAANLWVLAARDNVQCSLGGTPANVVERRKFPCGNVCHYLYQINLTGINGYGNSNFTADGVALVQIGPIPAIVIAGADPMITSFTERDTLFILGGRARITVAGIDQGEIQWNASAGGSVQRIQGEWELSCDQNFWGTRIIVSTEIAGRRISQAVRFLPSQMGQAMRQETAWSNCQDLRWVPDSDGGDIRREIENTEGQKVRGTLMIGEAEVKIWYPSTKPHHWFNEGLYDATVRNFDTVPEIAPGEIDWQNPPQLHIYIPEGKHRIFVGGTEWLVDLEGPDYFRKRIDVCPEWFDRQDDEVALLNVAKETRHIIARFNDRPPCMTLLLPSSVRESIEQFSEICFTISDLECKLRPLVVGDEPIAASSNWTGPALTGKLKLLRLRYTLPPNGTPYNPARSVTLPELRETHPLINGLVSIQGSTRPDPVWMPTSVFRIKHAEIQDGYHPLPDLHNGRNALQQNHYVILQFCFGRSTSIATEAGNICDFRWDIRDDDVILIQEQSQKNAAIAMDDLPSDLIDGYFRGALAWAQGLIGPEDIYHLGGLFPEVCKRFGLNPARRFIFQTAVLCRLRAWHGIVPRSVDERILAEGLRQQLAMICWKISEVPEANEIFISDVLTVEWSIAWFNNFNPQ